MGRRWTKKDVEDIRKPGFPARQPEVFISRDKPLYAFGIDPGVHTGIARWDCLRQQFILVSCVKIHIAMRLIENSFDTAYVYNILVRLEDARKHIWFGEGARRRIQGAGSVKRDCTIWEDFLSSYNIPFELVAPKANRTKVTAEWFKHVTGWPGRTNEHSRDAAMLVFGW